jgi:hypothetical protein
MHRYFYLVLPTICLIVIIGGFALTQQIPFIPYNPDQYSSLLTQLQHLHYRFIQPDQLNTTSGKRVIVLHDVDYDIHGAKTFVAIERKLGIRSTFFLRPDADYFTQSIPYFQNLERQGWKIGYHYDVLSRSNNNYTQARLLFIAQLTLMRAFFNITMTRAHGDDYNYTTHNINFYNATLWHSLGLQDFSTVKAPNTWMKDTNHILIEPTITTDLVVIEFHSDWW